MGIRDKVASSNLAEANETRDWCISADFAQTFIAETKTAVKLHTLLDLRGSIPEFIHITDGKLLDVNVLDLVILTPGAFYVMDRGYISTSSACTASTRLAPSS